MAQASIAKGLIGGHFPANRSRTLKLSGPPSSLWFESKPKLSGSGCLTIQRVFQDSPSQISLRISASVTTAEKPSTVPEIVLQSTCKWSGSCWREGELQSCRSIRGMTWKGYHNDSNVSESKAVAYGEMGTKEKYECHVEGRAESWWAPHHRTGIYCPRGQERVMEDVPTEAAKFVEAIHCFSSKEDVHALGGRK